MDSVGLAAIAAVLVVGGAVGLWRRRADGRLRPVPALEPAADRVDPGLPTAYSSAFCVPYLAVRRLTGRRTV